jgi:hypothetical protein
MYIQQRMGVTERRLVAQRGWPRRLEELLLGSEVFTIP